MHCSLQSISANSYQSVTQPLFVITSWYNKDTFNIGGIDVKLQDWFEKGMTFATYVDSMSVHRKELLHIYNTIELPKLELNIGTRVVVLTADWCGDAMLCVPIIQRMCEQHGVESRFLIRDENLELMDQYLTNGTSRAIPIFIFLNENWEEHAVWGPRSQLVQDFITTERAQLPTKEDPTFEDKQKAMYATFRHKLSTDTTIWNSVIESVTERLS